MGGYRMVGLGAHRVAGQKEPGACDHTIAPYYITTGMFDGVQSKVFPLLNPEKVAKRVLGAIEGNKKMLMLMKWIPQPHHFIRLLQGLLPMRVFDWLLGEVLGIYHTMDNFTGRK